MSLKLRENVRATEPWKVHILEEEAEPRNQKESLNKKEHQERRQREGQKQ